MRWRLYMFRETERWLGYAEGEDGHPDLDRGLELPAGAKVHSVVPLKTHRVADADNPHKITEAVAEWAVFVAVPLEEVAP